jgi:hypothetical protein
MLVVVPPEATLPDHSAAAQQEKVPLAPLLVIK